MKQGELNQKSQKELILKMTRDLGEIAKVVEKELEKGTLEIMIPKGENEFKYLEGVKNMLTGYGYKVIGKVKDDNNGGRYHVSFEKGNKNA